jgi:hypothetical protein
MGQIPRPCAIAAILAGALGLAPAQADTLRVGPDEAFATIAAAAEGVRDGDTVEILAGDYPGDAAVWRANGITIRGLGGRPHISAAGRHVEGKGTWLVKGNDVTIEHIELSGAAVPSGNGVAIRVEGRNLSIRDCYLHHNQMGLLAGIPDPLSTIRIERSEVAHSGGGTALGHGIYVGDIGELVVTGSYLHHASLGHNLKSRAAKTSLYSNRIADEADGNSSYLVDTPNGGRLVMVGNILQQGPQTDNYHLVRFGAEGIRHAHNEILAAHNTFVNLRPDGAMFLGTNGATRVLLVNNIFWGPGGFAGDVGDLSTNLRAADQGLLDHIIAAPVFRNVAGFDFRLAPGSAAVDAGTDVGNIEGADLWPRIEYVHPSSTRPRPTQGPLDIGAFEGTGD